MAKKLNGEAASQFEEGINMVLSRWTALQLAVHNNFGGPHSYRIPAQLSHMLFSLFTTSKEKVCDHDVVPMLKDSMNDLNTDFFDGEDTEYEEIAAKLRAMHEECLEGNFNSIERLKEAHPPRRVPYIQQDDSDDDDDDDTVDDILSNYDSSEMLVDSPKTSSRDFRCDCRWTVIDSPQTDEGWTVVGGSKWNKGRRN